MFGNLGLGRFVRWWASFWNQPAEREVFLPRRRTLIVSPVPRARKMRALKRSEMVVFVDLCKTATRSLPAHVLGDGGRLRSPAISLVRFSRR